MNKLKLTLKDILKILCIFIIGIANSVTIALLLRYVFNRNELAIAAIVLMAIVTICGIIMYLAPKLNNSKKLSSNN